MIFLSDNKCLLKAIANMKGNLFAPCLYGKVCFYDTHNGVKVNAVIYNLPPNKSGFYGFHLHRKGNCSWPDFLKAEGHYNPDKFLHPLHAGDFPMLLATDKNNAFLSFITTRFKVKEIIGRSVIIHYERDDYTTKPSGDAGAKIACGVIHKICKQDCESSFSLK